MHLPGEVWQERRTNGVNPTFSENSYGFLLKRRAHDAVFKAKQYINEGYTWVVDIDLEKFFDEVNHDRLMRTLSYRSYEIQN